MVALYCMLSVPRMLAIIIDVVVTCMHAGYFDPIFKLVDSRPLCMWWSGIRIDAIVCALFIELPCFIAMHTVLCVGLCSPVIELP